MTLLARGGTPPPGDTPDPGGPIPPGVGVWFDLRNPPGWRQDPARLYAFTLELCEEAERLGADSLWFTEHHGFEDGYLPQPLTFAAAAAARTRRVRLGTGILVAPLRKTAQLAEEAAVVDLVSGGRLDLGLGAGYRVPEFALFGTEFATRYRILDAQVAELRRLWGEGGLTPRPVQDRLPVWLGYQGPKGARRAGRLGEGLLTLAASSWPHYRDGLAEGGHDPGTARMGGGIQAYVTDDPDRDWPLVAPHIAYQADSYRRYMVEGTGQSVPRAADPERLRTRGPDDGPLSYFLFGTPEQVAAQIRAHAGDAPVRHVWLGASIAGLPEDLAVRHVQTICTRLRPLLAAPPPAPPAAAPAPSAAAPGAPASADRNNAPVPVASTVATSTVATSALATGTGEG